MGSDATRGENGKGYDVFTVTTVDMGDGPELVAGLGDDRLSEADGAVLREGNRRRYEQAKAEANERVAGRIKSLARGGLSKALDAADEGTLTQDAAAFALGMTRDRYGDIERGGKQVTASEVIALADAFHVPPEVLVSPHDGEDLEAEARLLRAFRKMTPEQRLALADLVESFARS